MVQRISFLAHPVQVAAWPLLLCLSACGGGGGGGNTESQSAEPAQPAENRNVPRGWETNREVWAAHPEFQGQPGLDWINAQDAYAAGITGAGVTIGFIDTGLDETHPEFAGKTIKLNDRSRVKADAAQLQHGTVSCPSLSVHAQVVRACTASPLTLTRPCGASIWMTAIDINDNVLAEGIAALEAAGARIINQSWSYRTTLNLANPDPQRSFLETGYGRALQQIRRKKAIHVFAAGNNAAEQVSVSAAWPQLFPELAGFAISVAALGQDGRIGRKSNHCGAAPTIALSRRVVWHRGHATPKSPMPAAAIVWPRAPAMPRPMSRVCWP